MTAAEVHKPDFDEVVKGVAGNTLNSLLPMWMESWAHNLTTARMGDSLDKIYQRPPAERVLIVGRGPSIHKFGHLDLLKKHPFPGHVIASDGAVPLLTERGIVPDYSMTVDGNPIIAKWFSDPATAKVGSKLKVILPVTVNPKTAAQCRDIKAHIFWYIPELDQEPFKGLTQALQLQTYSPANPTGLSRANGAGNCGMAAIVIASSIMRAREIVLIGMDGGYPLDTPMKQLHYHESLMRACGYKKQDTVKLYRMYYHPLLRFTAVDPIFEVYHQTFMAIAKGAMAARIRLVNCTQGGCLFGDGVEVRKFAGYLEQTSNSVTR